MAPRVRILRCLVSALPALVIGALSETMAQPLTPASETVILRGGTLVDGTGAAPRKGDLVLRGGRILAVGDSSSTDAARVIDVSGLIVAPGFIDLHTHSDDEIVKPSNRLNLNYLTQGVTTVVTGNCGSGPIDVAKYLAQVDANGAGTNVIHLIPHGSLRNAVMGNSEGHASTADLERMKNLVARGMTAGAWGMATGLIYLPGRYADTSELIELSRVVKQAGGIYASHIRNEEEGLLEAVDEAIEIGRDSGTPVHISHVKANGRANWGKAALALARIVQARKSGQVVTADQYPYIASSTKLGAMVVPHWAIRGDAAEFTRIAASPDKGPLLRLEIQKELERRAGGAAIRIARYAPRPSRVGRDLVTIAHEEGTTPLEVVLDIHRNGGAQAINFGMSEDDVRLIMRHDFVATASDGSAHRPGAGDRPHPRSYGTFPRKIRYSLDEHVIPIEQAIRSCSGLPADILGLPDRGVLRPGAVADVVVFDPTTFRDASTFDDPTVYAPGIQYLLVGGVALISEGKPTVKPGAKGKLPGRALRRQADGPAELILIAGRIWTGDAAQPWAEALASRNGAIVAIGKKDEVLRFRGPNTRVIDRKDAFAVPGLMDAHGHVESLGSSLEEIDLRDVKSLDEVAGKVKAQLKVAPSDAWVSGRNWDQSLWPGGEFPTAATLDAVAPDRPVWLRRVDGHAGWANSEAMRRARIKKESKAPTDGQIIRDRDGNPTGVFVDGAMGLVGRMIPRASASDLRRRILSAQRSILESGLTTVHDAGVSQAEVQVYRALEESGELKLRIYAMASPPDGGEVRFVSKPPPRNAPGARFELRAIKLFIDGAMGSRGALLFEPYHDQADSKGLLLIEPKTLEATVIAALKNGWQVATHAIGDRGNALVLDAYEAALKAVPEARDPRLRVEHAQVVRKADVPRYASLGIIASMQPSHASTDKRWADARLGQDRVKGAYAWRWFADAKVPLAFGSDFPVEIASPFWGIYAALTRQDADGSPPGGWLPEQRLTIEETLRGFTAGAAHAAFAEARLGVLKAGMQADVTVVDRDLFLARPLDILKSRVLATIIAGEVVHERR